MTYITKWKCKTFSVASGRPLKKIPLRNTRLMHKFFKNIFDNLDANQEHFVVVALDSQNNLLGHKTICSGMINEMVIDIRLVLRAVLILSAERFITVHNHPNKYPTQSPTDREHWKDLSLIATLLGLKLVGTFIYTSRCTKAFF